jgi:hypothetical protein
MSEYKKDIAPTCMPRLKPTADDKLLLTGLNNLQQAPLLVSIT